MQYDDCQVRELGQCQGLSPSVICQHNGCSRQSVIEIGRSKKGGGAAIFSLPPQMPSPGRAQSLDPNLHFNFRWTNGPVRMKTSECARRPRRNLLSWVRVKLASNLFLLLGEKTRVAGRTSNRERMARTSGTITCWRKIRRLKQFR